MEIFRVSVEFRRVVGSLTSNQMPEKIMERTMTIREIYDESIVDTFSFSSRNAKFENSLFLLSATNIYRHKH